MKAIVVKVKPNAPKTKIISETEKEIVLAVSKPAEQNKANIEIVKFLSKHFNANVKIVRGLNSKTKLLVIQ